MRHTFRVASSLDSLVVGEAQILGQLKDAFDIALKAKTTSTILNKLIKKSISVAKRVRTETRLAEGAVSISSAAVELAKKIFGDLTGKTVMLLGAGEMAELAAQHLLGNGVKNIMVANRTFERAEELAKEFKGDAIRFEHFPDALVMVDILICATGAPQYVVKRDMVQKVIKDRRHKPIFMIDISNPRNIDPEVDKVDNVYLYDIDDLPEQGRREHRGQGEGGGESRRDRGPGGGDLPPVGARPRCRADHRGPAGEGGGRPETRARQGPGFAERHLRRPEEGRGDHVPGDREQAAARARWWS